MTKVGTIESPVDNQVPPCTPARTPQSPGPSAPAHHRASPAWHHPPFLYDPLLREGAHSSKINTKIQGTKPPMWTTPRGRRPPLYPGVGVTVLVYGHRRDGSGPTGLDMGPPEGAGGFGGIFGCMGGGGARDRRLGGRAGGGAGPSRGVHAGPSALPPSSEQPASPSVVAPAGPRGSAKRSSSEPGGPFVVAWNEEVGPSVAAASLEIHPSLRR